MATLPYDVKDGVLPLITPKTLDLHYNKVCIGYCQTANDLIQGIAMFSIYLSYFSIPSYFYISTLRIAHSMLGTVLDSLDPMAILNRSKVDAHTSLLYHSLGSISSNMHENYIAT